MRQKFVSRTSRTPGGACATSRYGAPRRDIAAGELALVERHQAGLELHGELGAQQRELLLDLGRVAVGGDLVGNDVLARIGEVGALVERAPCAGDALLGVDDDILNQPGAGQRREREHGRGRIAARVGDDARRGDARAMQLGEPVHGLAQQLRLGVGAVPALVGGQRGEAEVCAQIDHARAMLS